MDRREFEVMQRSNSKYGWESWGFFRLSFTIIGVVLFLIWAADSATPG